MYSYEHFNLCNRCLETISPFGCCVYCNYAEEDSAIRRQVKTESPELLRIRAEVDHEMKILEAIL